VIGGEADAGQHLDPRRWVALVVVLTAAFIVVLDNTVLNVAIPTIRAELHTTLPSLLWVVTGYALTFATLLIIGGRLGDMYGHRRIFIIGAGLFGVGSFVASIATSVPQLILGEAVIEGIGASLMLPATLAILSTTFKGRERATAFAAWGASAGVAAAFGPVVGGWLTWNYSWRWAFRINVIIAPLAIIGALVFMSRGVRTGRRLPLDAAGAALIAVGMFLLVFALSEGATYGWWRPLRGFLLFGHRVWPASRVVSIMPIIFAVAVGVLIAFYFVERAKERRGAHPLFPFVYLRIKTYRYGLLTGLVLAMGQFGLSFVLPVFLQGARLLTPQQNGWWQFPTGIFIIIGAQAGGRLIRAVGTTVVVRTGLFSYVVGILLIAHAVSLHITMWRLLPGLAFYGIGIGFAGAQLTNVVMSEVPAESSGVASGANTTVRQVGAALGVAMIGSLLSAEIVSHAVTRLHAVTLPLAVKAQALAGVHASGAFYQPSASTSPHDASVVQHLLRTSVASGTRVALVFAASIVLVGAFLSFLIPRVAPPERPTDTLEPLEPLDIDPALLNAV